MGPKKERDISVNFATKRLSVAFVRKQLGCDLLKLLDKMRLTTRICHWYCGF